MANTTLTADVIAKSALAILDNELGVLDTFYRAPEDEYSDKVNGYKKGATISIRRPADFTVRRTSVMDVQDAIEGKVTFTVDQIFGADFQFSSTDQTLSVTELADRFIKPAVINVVNEMAAYAMETFYPSVYNWVGTPGSTIDSFSDFFKGPERLNEMAVPVSQRYAALSPADEAGMLGNLTGLYIQGDAKSAYRSGELGNVGGVTVNMSQVVPTHTNGTADNTTPIIRGSSNTTTYDASKNTWTMTLSTQGWDANATITAGTVFTIGTGATGVYMVNPKTKRSTGILQQFTVTSAVTANGTTSNETQLTISPPIITSGPHQTVNAAPQANAAISVAGSASTSYKQNLVYHKNAFAMAIVPMEAPPGAVDVARRTHKGISVRVIPVYDGINDVSKWRLDLLGGFKCIDPRLATRISGT